MVHDNLFEASKYPGVQEMQLVDEDPLGQNEAQPAMVPVQDVAAAEPAGQYEPAGQVVCELEPRGQ